MNEFNLDLEAQDAEGNDRVDLNPVVEVFLSSKVAVLGLDPNVRVPPLRSWRVLTQAVSVEQTDLLLEEWISLRRRVSQIKLSRVHTSFSFFGSAEVLPVQFYWRTQGK
jgi:hypothetical protein